MWGKTGFTALGNMKLSQLNPENEGGKKNSWLVGLLAKTG